MKLIWGFSIIVTNHAKLYLIIVEEKDNVLIFLLKSKTWM